MSKADFEKAIDAFRMTAEKRAATDRLVVHPKVFYRLLGRECLNLAYDPPRYGGLVIEQNPWLVENLAVAFTGEECIGIINLEADDDEQG